MNVSQNLDIHLSLKSYIYPRIEKQTAKLTLTMTLCIGSSTQRQPIHSLSDLLINDYNSILTLYFIILLFKA